jgi:hypothetical protein
MEIKEHKLSPEIRTFNRTGEQDKIYLSIQIGNGQMGGSKVVLGGIQIAKGNLSSPTFIGNSSDLINKVIEIETNVLDVNSFTNMCVITTAIFNQDNKALYTKIDNGDAPESGIASFVGKYKLIVVSLLVFILHLFYPTTTFAQSSIDKVNFQSLETPSSPGFILLDKAPSSIERPTTPQGFGINVLGLFQGTGGAMEFAPFWLVTHSRLTAEKMYKNKTPLLHHFSISVATIKTDTLSKIAGGFRTRLFQTYSTKKIATLDSIKKEMELALADLDIPKIESLQKQYTAIIEKPVFTIDLAAAIGGTSTSNSFKDVDLNRWATWLSFNLRPKAGDVYITALARYINNEKMEGYIVKTDLLDAGTRLNYDVSKFCIALEYLQRFNFSKKAAADYRIAAVGSYEFSDNIYITATFGKNFTDVNNIIALAGINFGISKSKIKAF